MSLEQSIYSPESKVEKERMIDLHVVCLYSCNSIDHMEKSIGSAVIEGRVDTVLLGEYDFTVEQVLNNLENIQKLAKDNTTDIILAPDNNESGGKFTWEELQRRLRDKGIDVETSSLDGDYTPETIGVYVGKNGFTYAFPKSWHRKEVHRPVHKIPHTRIGVTICGEIGSIDADDFEDIDILYNPSREGDDAGLRYRMVVKYGAATKEEIADMLSEDEEYAYLSESDEESEWRRRREDDYFYEMIQGVKDEGMKQKMMEFLVSEKESKKGNSRKNRREKLAEISERIYTASLTAQNSDSLYVTHVSDKLKELNIPVIRCDGKGTTGILNQLPDMQVADLKYGDVYARFNVRLEK